ncbi:cryptochrome/photolyase family protein [Stutzerimonas urumqiensis]|uniref:cryptochrome/photolyase family protein n=1 Tax=Stutzerimonas urumqiensis TaxID=638269 RepID=UPI000EAFCA77|nr:deoxyribodipyrimidine photo-lyase [Stutzerimonas urumqiensis]
MLQLIWLRTDLRADDNTALSAAMANGPTVALFLITPEQWRRHDDAACKVDFWLRNLACLGERLERLGVPLLIRQVPDWTGAPDVLVRVCHELRVAAVHVNDQYGVNEQRRDEAVASALLDRGVRFERHLDDALFAPGTIRTRTGGPFRVYGQFRKACLERLWHAPVGAGSAPRPQAPLGIAGDALPDRVIGFEPPSAELQARWPAGERHAQAQLARFVDERLSAYGQARDVPSEPGTSQLSPYLAAGVLSPRQCLDAALAANRGTFDGGDAGASQWIGELLWREFYRHVLCAFPRVSMGRAFRPETERLPWRHAPDELCAWQQGRTGIPLVDAAMRALLATGWMHNRLRMITAMFLSKNLLIDWREGERWFMRHLIDGDLAQNNGGWQWCASTGTDSVPYFRLFNPVTQSQRFDPQGVFIRQWAPELAHLSDRDIHLPPVSADLFAAADYPPLIVDLARSRARALDAFRQLSAGG